MKPAVALAALFNAARAGCATKPSTGTGPIGPSIPPAPASEPLCGALTVAAVVLAAGGRDSDPIQLGPNTNGSIFRAVECSCITIV